MHLAFFLISCESVQTILTAVKRPFLLLAISRHETFDNSRLFEAFTTRSLFLRQKLFFDRFEVKFAHAILRTDLIAYLCDIDSLR